MPQLRERVSGLSWRGAGLADRALEVCAAASAAICDRRLLAGSLLGPLVGRELQRTLKRVDGHAAMAIVLASPEFQRR